MTITLLQLFSMEAIFINQSKLLFSTDETIEKIFNQDKLLSNRDKEENLVKSAIYTIISIKKAEEALMVKEKTVIAFSLIQKLVLNIALY